SATTRTASRRASRRASSHLTTTGDFLFNSDRFVGLRDRPCHTFRALHTLAQSLALTFIKSPGTGEVGGSGGMHSQSKHEGTREAQSAKYLSHSRSPSAVCDC